MRNEHILIQFMEENGLEYNKPFWVKTKMGDIKFVIKKNTNEEVGFNIKAYVADIDSWVELDIIKLTRIMFDDRYKIIEEPKWKPKEGERYCYISVINYDIEVSFWRNSTFDIAMFLIGNVFKREEDAEINKKEIIEVFQRSKPFFSSLSNIEV